MAENWVFQKFGDLGFSKFRTEFLGFAQKKACSPRFYYRMTTNRIAEATGYNMECMEEDVVFVEILGGIIRGITKPREGFTLRESLSRPINRYYTLLSNPGQNHCMFRSFSVAKCDRVAKVSAG